MPSAKEIFSDLTSQLVEQGKKEFVRKTGLLTDYKTLILDPVLESGLDPKTAGGMARQYSEKRAELLGELGHLSDFKDVVLGILEERGVSDLPMEVAVFPAQVKHENADMPPPTSLAESAGENGESPQGLALQISTEAQEDVKGPFYPWRIDQETGRVFPVVDMADLKKRASGELSLRGEGIILATLSLKTEEKRFAYAKIEEALPDVYQDLLEDITDEFARKRNLYNYKKTASDIIFPHFLRFLRQDPTTWPQSFVEFIEKIKSLPVYDSLPESDFLSTIASVVKREILPNELFERAGQVEISRQDLKVAQPTHLEDNGAAALVAPNVGNGTVVFEEEMVRPAVEKAEDGDATTNVESAVVYKAPLPVSPRQENQQIEANIGPKFILSESETGMFGRLLTDDISWNELLSMWRNGGVVIDDEEHKMIRVRVQDFIREERKAGRDPYRSLQSLMIKLFSFADVDTDTRQAIIEAQKDDLASFFFELFLLYSKEEVRFFAKEFNNRFVSSLR